MTIQETLKEKFSAACTACGVCAAMCPPLAAAGPDETPSAIQEKVREFLEGGPPTGTVIARALLCNECYQCTVDTCPVGLDPMRTNLLLRGCLREQGAWTQGEFIPPSDPAADECVLAALLTTPDEFNRITTPFTKGDGRYLFFAGCNIYSMPDKLLTAMDIMDRLVDDWSFLPGLSNCCGGNHSTAGDLEAEQTAMNGLVDAFQKDKFEAIVLWCPTCVTLFHLSEVDLPTVSFARFVADRLPGQT
ncbi:(Fe-S)-binding protein, partial [bacterium]|nr:(Fe-S)-binding protein [bacterium]